MFLEKMFRVVLCILLLFIYMLTVVGQLPRLGKKELICLLLFTRNYVVSVWRGFLFLCVLGMGYVILLWHSLSLPYNYFVALERRKCRVKCTVHVLLVTRVSMILWTKTFHHFCVL